MFESFALPVTRWALAGCLLLVAMTWTTTAVAQDDFRKARALHKECKQLRASGKACKALAKCEAAMKARTSEPLEVLTKEVKEECSAEKRAKKKRADDKKENRDKPVEVIECPEGQETSSDTDGHCCWPGQAWSNGRTMCIGVPACPEGFVRAGDEACESLEAAQNRDVDEDSVPDFADLCPGEAEDLDQFEDEDGCPELDNDEDGIADVDDQCPAVAEDMDGFEDQDGCPEEGAVVADVPEDDKKVIAPAVPPPEESSNVLGIVGWTLTGVGGALLVTAVILDQTLLAGTLDDLEAAQTGPDYDDLRETLDGQRTMNAILFIGGGVLAVGGLTMGIISMVGGDSDTESAVQFTPMLGVDVVGSSVSIRW